MALPEYDLFIDFINQINAKWLNKEWIIKEYNNFKKYKIPEKYFEILECNYNDEDKTYDIKSVKRLSDNIIFNLGDHIEYNNGEDIKDFYVEKFESCYVASDLFSQEHILAICSPFKMDIKYAKKISKRTKKTKQHGITPTDKSNKQS